MTSQDTRREQPSKGHLLPGGCRGRDKLGNRKGANKQGTPTNWRQQREGQVRKESDQAIGTYKLKTIEGGRSQDMERKQLSKGHSHSRDGRWRDKSGYRKKVTV